MAHLETKQLHFEAAAQIRKSIDDSEGNRFVFFHSSATHVVIRFVRYGHEIARLSLALSLAQKGFGLARRAAVAPAVVNDIKVSPLRYPLELR